MEKVIYALWAPQGEDLEKFYARLREEVAPQLLKAGARGLQLNVRDKVIDPARNNDREANRPLMDAVAHVWMDSAVNEYR